MADPVLTEVDQELIARIAADFGPGPLEAAAAVAFRDGVDGRIARRRRRIRLAQAATALAVVVGLATVSWDRPVSPAPAPSEPAEVALWSDPLDSDPVDASYLPPEYQAIDGLFLTY